MHVVMGIILICTQSQGRLRSGSPGNFLVILWLGFGVLTAGAQVQLLVRELRSCKPWRAAKKKKKKKPTKKTQVSPKESQAFLSGNL